MPMHPSFPSEHWMIIQNCNQIPASPFQAAAFLQNQTQTSCYGNFQQSVILPMADIQAPHQIQRQMPSKLGGNNGIPTEHILKEANKNRILQNISNKIPHAKSREELVTDHSFPMYYQSMENFIPPPVTKQNTSIITSSKPNLNDSKLLKKYFEEQSNPKHSKDLPIVSGKREGLMPKTLEFYGAKRQDLLQSNNGNKLKTAIGSKNKSSSGECKKQRSGKVQCRYLTQNRYSETQKVFKTKFCNAISNTDIKIIQGRRRRQDLKEQGPMRQVFRKQRFLSTLLIHTGKTKTLIEKCSSFKSFDFLNKYQNHSLQRRNTVKEHSRMHRKLDCSDIDTKQNNFDDSNVDEASVCHLNDEDKHARPITVEYLKDVADYLLRDECDRDVILNSGCGKIDGFTHLKIAILEILRRSSLLLSAKKKLI